MIPKNSTSKETDFFKKFFLEESPHSPITLIHDANLTQNLQEFPTPTSHPAYNILFAAPRATILTK